MRLLLHDAKVPQSWVDEVTLHDHPSDRGIDDDEVPEAALQGRVSASASTSPTSPAETTPTRVELVTLVVGFTGSTNTGPTVTAATCRQRSFEERAFHGAHQADPHHGVGTQ